MRRTFILCSVCTVLIACHTAPSYISEGPDVIIRHIDVVDVERGVHLKDQLITIRNGAFTHIGADPGRLDTVPGARIIDGTGRYAMPGLWDMHAHVCWSDTNATLLLPVLLAHGITGVRDMGGDLRLLNDFKRRVAADPSLGPDIYGCGPIIDGDPPVFPDFTLPLDSTKDVEAALDSLAAGGADFFKVYSLLQQTELQRIAAYSHAHSLTFAGHLSEWIEPEVAIASGQHSIEHLNRLDEIWNEDPARIDSIAGLMVAHDAWSCPTLIVYHRKSHMHDPANRIEAMDALVPALQGEWAQTMAKRLARYGRPEQLDSLDQRFTEQLALVRRLHERGVRLLAGSDLSGAPFVYPGVGLLEELEWLEKAGVPTADVLRAATSSPAEYLNVLDRCGTIAQGKQAELVILSADPLAAARNVRSIVTVLHRGVVVEEKGAAR